MISHIERITWSATFWDHSGKAGGGGGLPGYRIEWGGLWWFTNLPLHLSRLCDTSPCHRRLACGSPWNGAHSPCCYWDLRVTGSEFWLGHGGPALSRNQDPNHPPKSSHIRHTACPPRFFTAAPSPRGRPGFLISATMWKLCPYAIRTGRW